MLNFYLSSSNGGPIINKVAFYTPTDLNYSVGDTVEIQFTSDLSLSQSLLADNVVSASLQHYLVFDISGSDLPQVGGLYTVRLIDGYIWGQTDVSWSLADFTWGDAVKEYDTERGFIVELIPTSSYTSSFETSSYTTHSFNYTPEYYTSSFETSSYYTASLNISSANAYISVRENGTYYVYQGY